MFDPNPDPDEERNGWRQWRREGQKGYDFERKGLEMVRKGAVTKPMDFHTHEVTGSSPVVSTKKAGRANALPAFTMTNVIVKAGNLC